MLALIAFKERKFFYIPKKNSVFTSFRLSLQEFKKIPPNTFIYESILIKLYMNDNIMNTQIFHLIKYDLNVHWRSQKVTFMFSLTLTYVLMDNFLSLFTMILIIIPKLRDNIVKTVLQSKEIFFYKLMDSKSVVMKYKYCSIE